MAVENGASAIGLVSEMPSGPGVIGDADIAAIARVVEPDVDTFLLTARRHPDDIVAQHERTGTTTLQLVDMVGFDVLDDLRDRLPGVRLVQVVHVRGLEAVGAAVAIADRVDAILLDSGNPDLSVKELGGTGRTHDWEVSREVVRAVACPVYLAGGLNAGNVGAAIEIVGPYGVDLCTGVRTDGRLDATKLGLFMNAVQRRSADA
jgi:phosphoribosylanthranilate isomerase